MTKDEEPKETTIDVQVTLRESIPAIFIVGSSNLKIKNRVMIYYVLSNGKLALKDSRDSVGSRNVEVRKGNIICLLTNLETGYEEFCGYLDEEGNASPTWSSKYVIPDRLRARVQKWCKSSKRFDHEISESPQ
jgi:hypothetical protein